MASEVSRINSYDRLFYARRRTNDLERSQLLLLESMCTQLPDDMRSYAAALRERNLAIEAVTPKNGNVHAIIDLSGTIKLITGAFRDEVAAELLNTASIALDGKEQTKFNAQSIAQARYRKNRKKLST